MASPGQAAHAQGRARRIAGGSAPGGTGLEDESEQERRRRTIGPIVGVRSRSKEEGSRKFMGSTSYANWQFTTDLIPAPVTIPDTLLIPRPTSDWVGKPFREDLQPKQGRAPEPNRGLRRDDDD